MKDIISSYQLHYSPDTPVNSLNETDFFIIEIMKAIFIGARIVLVDDFSLECNRNESEQLMNIIGSACKKGISFVLTSSRITLLQKYCSRISFLSNGRIIKTVQSYDVSIIKNILPGLFPFNPAMPKDVNTSQNAEIVLSVQNLNLGILEPMDIEIHRHEITILVDPTKTIINKLLDRLFHNTQTKNGMIEYKGKKIKNLSRNLYKKSVMYLDADNLGKRLRCLNLTDNINIGLDGRVTTFGVIRTGRARHMIRGYQKWCSEQNIPNCLDQNNIVKSTIIAFKLFRLSILKPNLCICRNFSFVPDLHIVQSNFKTLASMGTAVLILTSNTEGITDIADTYYVLSHNKKIINVAYKDILSEIGRI